jgi:hypothetical protein
VFIRPTYIFTVAGEDKKPWDPIGVEEVTEWEPVSLEHLSGAEEVFLQQEVFFNKPSNYQENTKRGGRTGGEVLIRPGG